MRHMSSRLFHLIQCAPNQGVFFTVLCCSGVKTKVFYFRAQPHFFKGLELYPFTVMLSLPYGAKNLRIETKKNKVN